MRSGLRASTSPISSSSTSSAGRPSSARTQGPWLAVTSWTGPIGVQPCERPVISGTSGLSRTPETPPSVGRPASCSGGAARRAQAADQERAAAGAEPGDGAGGAAVARIAVDHAAADRAVLRPGGERPSRSGGIVAQPVDQAEAARRQARDQHDDRAALGVLRAAAADRSAAGADPVAHAGRRARRARDQVERVGVRIARVDEAEIGRRRQIRAAPRCRRRRRGASPCRARRPPGTAPCPCPPAGPLT